MSENVLPNFRIVARGLWFPEGPVALADGSVLVTEMRSGRIVRCAPDGTLETVADCGGGPNGAALGPDGALYVCNNGGGEHTDDIGGRIQRVDLDSGAVEDLYRASGGHPLQAPNDLVFDAAGGFWFTDFGKRRARDADLGAIHYARTDTWRIQEVVFPTYWPNGIGLSPDGTALYWTETYTGRVWRRTVAGPGRLAPLPPLDGPVPLHPAALLATLGGVRSPDSLAVDGAGNVCIGVIGAQAGIAVVSPAGDVTHFALPEEVAEWGVTNLCFGGPERRTAYITLTSLGLLAACDWPVPGVRLHHG